MTYKPTTRHSPWVIAIFTFFALVVLFNVLLVKLALNSSRGYIENAPYKRGIEYQNTITKENLISSLGLKAEVLTQREGPETVRVMLKIAPAPTGIEFVHARALRFADRTLDTAADLIATAPGVYSAPMRLAASGLWRLEFDFAIAGQTGLLKVDRLIQ
ncbi:MAG: FixH family protein [Oligoflexia bacterium]|nr:FixH family protein [Oligoflexia bacterium]